MINTERQHKRLSVLDSGEEFFGDLFEQISSAQDYILIKQFLWRNDAAGQAVAKKLLEAMERGVKVIVLKDRIGAFHEYGEGGGQSFFHDTPLEDSPFSTHSLSTVYAQANIFLSKFYSNGVSPQEKNPLRRKFVDHPNATVVDEYKLYDHSKVVVIDGKTAYMGGIGFADEFSESDDKWSDYMIRIDDSTAVSDLLRVLAGENPNPDRSISERFHTGSSSARQGRSLHSYVLDRISDSKDDLLIEMPFLGNPDYINAIAQRVRAGVRVHIILPETAPSHHYRNMHFIKTLRRRAANSDRLDVALSPTVNHGKSIVSDGKTAILGSHNLHMDSDVLEETILETSDQCLVSAVKARLTRTLDNSFRTNNSPPWRKIIVPSRLEYLSVKLQTLMSKLRSVEIARGRAICQAEIKKLL